MDVDYANKLILAPMVRAGTLPFRLLSLRHGADLVYGEEIIDKKIQRAERRVNSKLGLVEFVHNGKVVYSTCEEEAGKNIFQIGTASGVSALLGAEVIARDVAGIDVNMGCPKHFSVSGGMGCALLTKPETIVDILTTLRRNLPVPITAKIRLLPDHADTLQLVKTIESTGVKAIGIHARTKEMRKEVPAIWERVKRVVDENISVPIIHNGDVFAREDIAKCKEATGASSVMIARGALWNVSIFEEEQASVEDLVTEYLKLCVDVENVYQNAKFTSLSMLSKTHTKDERNFKITSAKSLEAVCKAFDVGDYYAEHDAKYNSATQSGTTSE
mmetsp:Transcript_7225/g.8942  ORF Transcript_7225/g.8942 Transcript_7225/m.8942 type:complete len:330 (-) Transcript_7225:60-1049(-)